MTEEWRIVDRFPNYEVSSLGRVRRLTTTTSTKAGRILRPALHYSGYYHYGLGNREGRTVTIRRNRLVCEAFHGPAPADRPEAAHRDGDRTNDCAENLYWATKKENAADKERHGRTARGERMSSAKLTEEKVRDIRRCLADGEYQTSLAPKFGVSKSLINAIAVGRAWAHVGPLAP